jgi:hypothetical protein
VRLVNQIVDETSYFNIISFFLFPLLETQTKVVAGFSENRPVSNCRTTERIIQLRRRSFIALFHFAILEWWIDQERFGLT